MVKKAFWWGGSKLMPTERQKRVVKKISENIGNKKYNSKGELLKDCDYSESISKSPDVIINSKGVQEELKPIIKELEKERNRAIKAMRGKISDAKYRDLVDSVDKMTKNIQLLSGKETESIKTTFELDEQTKKEINSLASRRNRG